MGCTISTIPSFDICFLIYISLLWQAYYAYIKFVSNTFEVSDAGMVEGMIVTGVLGLANAAVFM